MRRLLWLLVFGVCVGASAQSVSVSGASVQDGTGAILGSGQWCFSSTCISVSSGSFSGTVTAGTQTVTVKNASAATVLTVPNVYIATGQPFNWNTFIVPPNTAATGLGAPYLPCAVGSNYTNTGTSAVSYCQSYSGQAAWGSTQSPASPGFYTGYNAPAFPCISPCLFTRIDAQSTYAAVGVSGQVTSTWVAQSGSATIPVIVSQGGTGATTATAALASLAGVSSSATALQTLAGPLAGPGIVRSIIADGAVSGVSTTLQRTANTTAINATVGIVSISGGGAVLVPNGTFYTNGDIVVPSNVQILGEGPGSVISFNPGACPCVNGVNHEAFYVAGTLTTRRQVAAAVAVGATSFTLASSGDGTDLVAGEWLIVEEYDAGAGSNQVVSTWVQVLSVSGTTVNVVAPFKTAIPHLRTWSNTAPISGSSFYGITALNQGASFKNFSIVVGLPSGMAGGDLLPGIYIAQAARGTVIDDVQVDDAAGNSLAVFLASDLHVSKFRSYASRLSGGGAPEIASTSGFSITNSLFANYYTANSTSAAANYSAALAIDNGSEFFSIGNSVFDNGGAFSLLLNTAPHDCSITGNTFGWTAQTPGDAVGGIGVQRCVVVGNVGAGGAGYGVDLVSSSGWTVNVTSQGNVGAPNIMNNYTGGPIDGVNASASDTYLIPGPGYWALHAPTFFAAGLSYGSSSSNADGKFTLMDASNNTVIENTGANYVGVKVNGNYKMAVNPNGLLIGNSASIGSLNIVLPFFLTGYHGSSGTKVQLNDGTGATGHCAQFAGDGSITDAGAACSSGGGTYPGAGIAVSTGTGWATSLPAIAPITITTGTTAIAANTCTSNTAATMTGVATTSVFDPPTPTSSTVAVTGWGANGGLSFAYYPTANTFNWSVCNTTGLSITPGSSLTWNVGAR